MRERRSRPRVLLYTDAGGRGGAEISLGHLLAGAATERWDLHLAGTTRAVLSWLANQRGGVPAHLVDPGITAHIRLLARLRPDIVHVNLPVPWGAPAALAAAVAAPGCRTVVVEQLPLRTTSAVLLWRTRALALRADAVVAVGEACARRVEDFYALGRESVHSIPNGVPDPGVPPPCPGSGPLVVGSLGRLDAVKGYDVLLHALPRVPGVRAVVVGDGGERASLQALTRRLGLADRVQWRGWTEEPSRELAGFDVYCQPSRSEGFPLGVVEAMLGCRPVVASAVGSIPEALDDGRAGLLVPPDDPAALADALIRLRDDPGIGQTLADAARRRAVARYTAARMGTTYEALWAEVLARPRVPRLRVPHPRD